MGCHAADDRNLAEEAAWEDSWYLLRRSIRVFGVIYPAGSVVRREKGRWYVDQVEGGLSKALPLDLSMVCAARYDGVSLFVVESDARGALRARSVSVPSPSESIDPLLVMGAVELGEGRVFARFGQCFLPLEFFGW